VIHIKEIHFADMDVGEGDGTKLGREPTGQLFLALALEEKLKNIRFLH
jgi:hypothetical protein